MEENSIDLEVASTAYKVFGTFSGSPCALARKKLEGLLSAVESLPVKVINIVGESNTGKSFLMNLLIHYLENGCTKVDGQIDYNGGFPTGFRKGQTYANISIYPQIFVRKNLHGNDIGILLMETQGIFDGSDSNEALSMIFRIAKTASNTIIFNVKNEKVNIKDIIAVLNSLDAGNKVRHGDLIFLMRDKAEAKPVFELTNTSARLIIQDLKHAQNSFTSDRSTARWRKLNNHFESVACAFLPKPGTVLLKRKFDGNMNSLSPSFVSGINLFFEDVTRLARPVFDECTFNAGQLLSLFTNCSDGQSNKVVWKQFSKKYWDLQPAWRRKKWTEAACSNKNDNYERAPEMNANQRSREKKVYKKGPVFRTRSPSSQSSRTEADAEQLLEKIERDCVIGSAGATSQCTSSSQSTSSSKSMSSSQTTSSDLWKYSSIESEHQNMSSLCQPLKPSAVVDCLKPSADLNGLKIGTLIELGEQDGEEDSLVQRDAPLLYYEKLKHQTVTAIKEGIEMRNAVWQCADDSLAQLKDFCTYMINRQFRMRHNLDPAEIYNANRAQLQDMVQKLTLLNAFTYAKRDYERHMMQAGVLSSTVPVIKQKHQDTATILQLTFASFWNSEENAHFLNNILESEYFEVLKQACLKKMEDTLMAASNTEHLLELDSHIFNEHFPQSTWNNPNNSVDRLKIKQVLKSSLNEKAFELLEQEYHQTFKSQVEDSLVPSFESTIDNLHIKTCALLLTKMMKIDPSKAETLKRKLHGLRHHYQERNNQRIKEAASLAAGGVAVVGAIGVLGNLLFGGSKKNSDDDHSSDRRKRF